MDAKRQRLKNEETEENNLETKGAPIRADVDLAEDKPTTAQTMACNPGLLDSSQEFTRSPHPILKAQTEPEFEGELLLSISCNSTRPQYQLKFFLPFFYHFPSKIEF